MYIDPSIYIHELDKTTLKALKAIPGFSPLMKAFMGIWNEQSFHIENMSSNVRISEKQLPRYYNMLVSVCKKLDIDIPDFYLTLNVVPNAYTYGDQNPMIVITSGLLETIPDELIPTVLAHECGHILCHHCLYRSMGSILLNSISAIPTIGSLVTTPIMLAFAKWMRCSELSADRVAAIYDNTSANIVEMCMRFAGFDKDILDSANPDEFMKQAEDYITLTKDSGYHKLIEFINFGLADHPLNSIRAYECKKWCENDTFNKITQVFSKNEKHSDTIVDLPLTHSSEYYKKIDINSVIKEFGTIGFSNIITERVTEFENNIKDNSIKSINVNGSDFFEKNDWVSENSEIKIIYYKSKTEEEISAEHPGEIKMPESSKYFIGKNYEQVIYKLNKLGFNNITQTKIHFKKGPFDLVSKFGNVISISINGIESFEKNKWFDKTSNINISYYAFIPDEDNNT